MNRYNAPSGRIFGGSKDMTCQTPWDPSGQTTDGDGDGILNDMPLAMIYAPESTFSNIYEECEAHARGTLFSDLYFPFEATCAAFCQNGGMMR